MFRTNNYLSLEEPHLRSEGGMGGRVLGVWETEAEPQAHQGLDPAVDQKDPCVLWVIVHSFLGRRRRLHVWP